MNIDDSTWAVALIVLAFLITIIGLILTINDNPKDSDS